MLRGSLLAALAGLACLYAACATGDQPDNGEPPDAGDDTAVTPDTNRPDVLKCEGGSACNGSCVDTRTDPKNCGGCGVPCTKPGYECKNAQCVQTSCVPPLVNCADAGAPVQCIDPSKDLNNCGGCGKACGANETCGDGGCVSNCAPPLVGCSDGEGGVNCVDLTSDNSNCGSCGNACPPQATCTATDGGADAATGGCACPSGQTLCPSDAGLVCIDTQSDDNNCGGCGVPCTGGTHCVGGQCLTAPSQSIVFVTSAAYSGGSLGGLSGADAKCAALGKAANLPRSYMAWLSDSKTSAASRLAHWSTPFVLADGATQVASGWTQIVSGTLSHAIDMTETKGTPPNGTISKGVVWTNTNPNGTTFTTTDCGDWTNNAAQLNNFSFGLDTSTTGYWTLEKNSTYFGNFCAASYTAPLYCFGQ